MRDVLTMIMAGGRGSRLHPLTQHRTKPAVPFAGTYRIIDFTLSNCIHSGLRQIHVITQYKSSSLTRHIHNAWNILADELGEFIQVLPPQKRIGEQWYQGTADSIYQNIYCLDEADPRDVLVLGGDHIYKMDYRRILETHRSHDAAATISVVDVPRSRAQAFGVLQVNNRYRVTGFEEKPDDPPPMPNRPDRSLVSMGIYCFRADPLRAFLRRDAADETSRHDFGHDIIPSMVDGDHRVQAHLFRGVEGRSYWQDVGTLRSYYEASMDMLGPSPALDLHDADWNILTYHGQHPPGRVRPAPDGTGNTIENCLLSSGVLLEGARVHRSILSPRVSVAAESLVEDSILLNGARVGPGCQLKGVILDKYARVPGGCRLEAESNGGRFPSMHREEGLLVVPRSTHLDPEEVDP